MRVAFHENDGNHENDEDNSDSYKRGGECWIGGNHGSESVKCRFSKCRFSAELEKSEKNIRDGGQRRKINPKSLGPVFSLCRHAGIDAALAKADLFFAGAPTIENRIEQKTQNTKVASAKDGLTLSEWKPRKLRKPQKTRVQTTDTVETTGLETPDPLLPSGTSHGSLSAASILRTRLCISSEHSLSAQVRLW